MSPDEAEALPDTLWDAMVRRIQSEADAIAKSNAQLNYRR